MDKKPITLKIVKKHCSRIPGAEIKYLWSGGWRVSTPSGGYADIKPTEIKNTSGGADIYALVTAICKDSWGQMTVRGTSTHILASMAHGEEQGLLVIPENRDGLGCLTFLLYLALVPVGYFAFFLSFAIGIVFLPPETVTILAVLVTIWAVMGAHKSGKDSITRKARQAARQYHNPFPDVHGSDRDATREAIGRRGLL